MNIRIARAQDAIIDTNNILDVTKRGLCDVAVKHHKVVKEIESRSVMNQIMKNQVIILENQLDFMEKLGEKRK